MQWHRWIASIALAAVGGHPWLLAAGVDRSPGHLVLARTRVLILRSRLS